MEVLAGTIIVQAELVLITILLVLRSVIHAETESAILNVEKINIIVRKIVGNHAKANAPILDK